MPGNWKYKITRYLNRKIRGFKDFIISDIVGKDEKLDFVLCWLYVFGWVIFFTFLNIVNKVTGREWV